jgi:hypothetical protein
MSSVSPLPPDPPNPVEAWPLESAFLNVLNAALFSLPTPPTLEPPVADLGAVVSSRLPTAAQPEPEPEKRIGWQSWPAATRESSETKARDAKGREEVRMLMIVGPAGYTIEMELS